MLLLVAIAIASFTMTRAGLFLTNLGDISATPWDVVRIFVVGLTYDVTLCAFAVLVPAVIVAAIPQVLWKTRGARLCAHVFALLTIYAIGYVMLAEVLFWDEFEVRFNFIAVDYLIYTHEVIRNILESYPVVEMLSGLGALSLVVYGLVRGRISRALDREDTLLGRQLRALVLGLTAVVLALVQGQGLRHVSANPFQNELASNGPYQFVAAFRNNELDYGQFYAVLPVTEVDELLRNAVIEPNAQFTAEAAMDLSRRVVNQPRATPLNLVVIMVESLSAEYLTRYGHDPGLTPRLDVLATESLVFDRLYATGTRTTRGLEAFTLSLPPTPGRSIVKRIGRESGMQSIGHILRHEGYGVEFLYGGRGYFDNMNAFFGGNGYEVVDEADVPDDLVQFSNAWGMSDEDLFQLAARRADEATAAQKPFFFHVMTTSNHRPFTYPSGRIDIPSGAGRHGAVKYTDWAIGDFLDRARSKPWFDSTVFVIVADHCASSAGKMDLPLARYHIPCFVYAPEIIEPRMVDTLASQIDLAPTLLALLGISYESTFVGRDILTTAPGDGRALLGTYQCLGLFEDGLMTVLTPRGAVEQRPDGPLPATEVTAARRKELASMCIAYYQGASYIFDHRLNRSRLAEERGVVPAATSSRLVRSASGSDPR